MKNTNKAVFDSTTKLGLLEEKLARYLKDGLVIAFSGGVDSGFLLWAAQRVQQKYGGKLLAYTTKSASMPQHDIRDVNSFVECHNLDHIWKESKEIENPDYAKNDHLRCYYCKFEQFEIAKDVAAEKGCKWIAYGFNASDYGDTRPGHQAAKEHGILYPLATSEFTKEEIRSLLKEHDIELSDKPSSPCLSSRIMTGVEITPEKLSDIDDLENVVREAGVRIFRLRMHELQGEKLLRLEVHPSEMEKALQCKQDLVEVARTRGYRWVTMDLEGYKTGGGNL